MYRIVDGIRIAYDDAGSGSALILLHGFPFDRTIWRAQFEPLARLTRVIAVDLRGSGESDCGTGPALMETLAGDVFGLLDALDAGRIVLAGHSMGGYVALAFFRMYSERVAGLALVASHTAADTPAQRIERDAAAQAMAANGPAAPADAIAAEMLERRFAATNPTVVARVRALAARANPVGTAAQIVGMKERVDSTDLLEDIRVPALIIAGESDPFIAPASLERTASAISDCEFVALPGVAHLPMLEAPELTTAALARLVARCNATAARS